jgi:DMSO reductase family type II enzyme heme b subunit
MTRIAPVWQIDYRARGLSAGCILLAAIVVWGCSPPPPRAARPAATPTAKQPAAPTVATPTDGATPKDGATPDEDTRANAPPVALTGAELYLQHCAGCHGERGDGKGVAAFVLFPKPRDFRTGRFRLVSTENQAPSAEDIDAVIKRGMPGSSMPAWPNLSESERQLLVAEVQKFYREGARDSYIAQLKEAEGDDFEVDAEEADAFAESRTAPGEVVESPKIPAADEASIARGREIYVRQACASCHGATGKGDGQQQMADSEGLPTRPRDLTRGIFKGSDDPQAVFLRLKIGMPGTPMPASGNLTDAEMIDLTHFLLSLSTPEIRAAAELNRERIVAPHVANIATDPNDASWNDVPAQVVRLTPLWWRDDATPTTSVQAVHDGEQIAVRLVWEDATADRVASRTEAFRDGAGLELVTGSQEPFLGMGGPGAVVDAWMWDAARDGTGGQVEDTYPRVVVDDYPITEKAAETAEYERPGTETDKQDPVVLTAEAVGNQFARSKQHASGGTSLVAAGPGTVTFRLVKSQLVTAHGHWEDGRWAVIFTRPLNVQDAAAGVTLTPGKTASIAIAVWDGAHQDRNGQKQVSIWQDLELQANPR